MKGDETGKGKKREKGRHGVVMKPRRKEIKSECSKL